MKKLILLSFLTVLVYNFTLSQKVHAFIFCNTLNPDIGIGAKINLYYIAEFSEIIAKAYKYEISKHEIIGIAFTKENIMHVLKNTSIDENDIVILYYNSHGYKLQGDDDLYPVIYFSSYFDYISPLYIHEEFMKRGNKFTLSIVEACNDYEIPPVLSELTSSEDEYIYSTYPKIIVGPMVTPDNFKIITDLFSQSCDFIVSSSRAGDKSISTNYGSIFTLFFLKTFYENIKKPAGKSNSWSTILSTVQKSTYSYSLQSDQTAPHSPICTFLCKEEINNTSNTIPFFNSSLMIKCSPPKNTERGWGRGLYHVELSVQGIKGIRSVAYSLGMEEPEELKISSNSADKFLFTYEKAYPHKIEAKVTFLDGEVEILYSKIDFDNCH